MAGSVRMDRARPLDEAEVSSRAIRRRQAAVVTPAGGFPTPPAETAPPPVLGRSRHSESSITTARARLLSAQPLDEAEVSGWAGSSTTLWHGTRRRVLNSARRGGPGVSGPA